MIKFHTGVAARLDMCGERQRGVETPGSKAEGTFTEKRKRTGQSFNWPLSRAIEYLLCRLGTWPISELEM